VQNDVRIGEDVLQLLYDHRKEEVSTNGSDALNRERSTNSWAASYNARRGANLLNAAIRRDNSVYGSKNTGSVGYGYDITSQLRATASYGTSFRAPTYNELYYPGYGNAANKPEQGKNAEIGIRWDDGVNALSASYYHNKLTDLLVSVTPCPYTSVPSRLRLQRQQGVAGRRDHRRRHQAGRHQYQRQHRPAGSEG
jgi:vitamin B12 transporter